LPSLSGAPTPTSIGDEGQGAGKRPLCVGVTDPPEYYPARRHSRRARDRRDPVTERPTEVVRCVDDYREAISIIPPGGPRNSFRGHASAGSDHCSDRPGLYEEGWSRRARQCDPGVVGQYGAFRPCALQSGPTNLRAELRRHRHLDKYVPPLVLRPSSPVSAFPLRYGSSFRRGLRVASFQTAPPSVHTREHGLATFTSATRHVTLQMSADPLGRMFMQVDPGRPAQLQIALCRIEARQDFAVGANLPIFQTVAGSGSDTRAKATSRPASGAGWARCHAPAFRAGNYHGRTGANGFFVHTVCRVLIGMAEHYRALLENSN